MCCPLANVDEVFVDLCRQMLRKEDSEDNMNDKFHNYQYEDGSSSKKYRKKRRNRENRCVVL
jgi:hypothetical protein